MTGVDVEHTKALEQVATPGPWVARPSPMGAMLPDEVFASGESFGRNVPAECHQREDAEFIAHARTAVPALVAAVERVQALHTPDEFGMCEGCGDNEHGYAIVPHPCPTIRALETP